MRTALRDLRLSPSFSERGTPPPILFKDYHQVSGDWGVVSLSEGRGGEVWSVWSEGGWEVWLYEVRGGMGDVVSVE